MTGSAAVASPARIRIVFVDTAVLAYAIGGDHPLRAPCRAIVAAAGAGSLELHASVEMVQELLFHRLRVSDRITAVRQARDASRLCVLHDFDAEVLHRMLELTAAHESIGGRDAVHAATALVAGIAGMMTPDRAFDRIPGLTRIDPADAI